MPHSDTLSQTTQLWERGMGLSADMPIGAAVLPRADAADLKMQLMRAQLADGGVACARPTAEQRSISMPWGARLRGSPALLSAAAGALVLLLLVTINPPFVHARQTNPMYRARPDFARILTLSAAAAAITYLLPLVLSRRRSSRHQ